LELRNSFNDLLFDLLFEFGLVEVLDTVKVLLSLVDLVYNGIKHLIILGFLRFIIGSVLGWLGFGSCEVFVFFLDTFLSTFTDLLLIDFLLWNIDFRKLSGLRESTTLGFELGLEFVDLFLTIDALVSRDLYFAVKVVNFLANNGFVFSFRN
jgi:hypothetical protein